MTHRSLGRFRIALRAVAVLVISISALVAPVGPSAEALTSMPVGPITAITPLTLTSFGAIAIDQSHGWIFVSEGEAGDTVDVLDLRGELVTSLTGLAGPNGLVVRGSTLFVAETGAGDITRFDLTTPLPTPLTSFDVSSLGNPRDLVFAGGRLWFDFDPWCGPDPQAGSITASGSNLEPFQDAPWSTDCITLESSAPAATLLVNNVTNEELQVWDVSGSPQKVTTEQLYVGRDMDALPDGGLVATYSGEVARHGSVSDLSSAPVLYDPMDDEGTMFPNATVGTTANGGLIAAARERQTYPNAFIWRAGEPGMPLAAYALPGVIAERGMSFSPDGTLVYGVGTQNATATLRLYVLRAVTTSQLTLANLGKVRYGESAVLTIHLEGGGTNRTVDVYEQVYRGTRTLLTSAEVNDNGDLSIEVTPRYRTAYEVEYAGDEEWSEDSVTREVLVMPILESEMRRFYGTDGKYKLFHDADRVWFFADVDPPRPQIHVIAQIYYRRWRTILEDDFNTSDKGAILLYFNSGDLPTGGYRIKAVFNHDALLLATENPFRYFRVT